MQNKDPSRPQPFPFAEPLRRPQKISEAQKRRIKLIEANITRTIDEMGQLHDMKMNVQSMKDEIQRDLFQDELMIDLLERWYNDYGQNFNSNLPSTSNGFATGADASFPWQETENECSPSKVMKMDSSGVEIKKEVEAMMQTKIKKENADKGSNKIKSEIDIDTLMQDGFPQYMEYMSID